VCAHSMVMRDERKGGKGRLAKVRERPREASPKFKRSSDDAGARVRFAALIVFISDTVHSSRLNLVFSLRNVELR